MVLARLALRIDAIRPLAEDIIEIELARPDRGSLPCFSAGAHIELHLPGGLSRSYSLCNPPKQTGYYRVAVKRDRASRGRSAFIHEQLTKGDVLQISPPRNQFSLDEGEHESVLIAGGIGVTPLYCMAQRLAALGREWQMHFAAHSRRGAAFLGPLQRLCTAASAMLCTYFDDEAGGAMMNLRAIVATNPDAHFYCCGPASMLQAFREATAGLPQERTHLEHFGATPMDQGRFEVELARSGRVLSIRPGETILDVLLAAGVSVDYSCRQGVCGSCRTAVLAGKPDHRDFFLTAEEHSTNKIILVCCSGSHSERLVLDA
jgi:tetrachlorobenzoquinone reductase